MVQLVTVKSSTVPSKLCCVDRTFMCWNGFLAHNLSNNLNCNKYEHGERIVTSNLVFLRFCECSELFTFQILLSNKPSFFR